MTATDPVGRASAIAATAAIPLEKARAVPPSSSPSAASKAVTVALTCWRPYRLSSGELRYGADSTTGTLSGSPGSSGRPAVTTIDSGCSFDSSTPETVAGKDTPSGRTADAGAPTV